MHTVHRDYTLNRTCTEKAGLTRLIIKNERSRLARDWLVSIFSYVDSFGLHVVSLYVCLFHIQDRDRFTWICMM
jgi:hypothetical protein